MKKIALFSLADIGNYGDEFFPLVVKNELDKRLEGTAEIHIYTNTIVSNDNYITREYSRELLLDEKYDAFIYAGGEMVFPYDNDAFRKLYGEQYKGTPSDIAFDWLNINGAFKAWFGVGIHPVAYEYPNELDRAKKELDYLSVRGVISKKVLDGHLAVNNPYIRISPDLGWLFPKYIDKHIQDNRSKTINLDCKYMVFQASEGLDIYNQIDFIANALNEFQSKSGIKVVLLPIMKTKGIWNEAEVMRAIYDASHEELLLLSNELDILQVGEVIKKSMFFVGSSLHGAITALAYGKPAVNIREGINTKIQDLHGMRDRATCFANSWSCLPGVLERIVNEANNKDDSKYAHYYAEYMSYRLGKEFDNLVGSINGMR